MRQHAHEDQCDKLGRKDFTHFLQAPQAGHSDHDEDFVEVEILKDAAAM